jgi:Protein of unknown function (DUF2917)
MEQQLMSQMQQSSASAAWQLEAGRTLRLPTSALPRRVRVTHGRLWLTVDSRKGDGVTEDIWLCAGDEYELAPGSSWLAEAWGCVGFLVLLPPQSAGVGSVGAVLRSFSAGAGKKVSIWLAPPSSRSSRVHGF